MALIRPIDDLKKKFEDGKILGSAEKPECTLNQDLLQNQQNVSARDETPTKDENEPQIKFDSLSKTQYWAYGVGHFVNDLSSACWFNYLLYYLNEVVKVKFGPYSILSGQIADALATPFVGFLSDRTNTKIGKRMPWYIGGYMVLLLTFVPMWSGCLLCDWFPGYQWIQIFYYIFFPAVFNFGWAALQISHMSLVPSLSCGKSRRDGLNSLRNTFSFLAILFIYCTALVLFKVVEDPLLQFKYLSYIAMAVGSLTTLFFILKINEPQLTSECSKIARKLQKILMNRNITNNVTNNIQQNVRVEREGSCDTSGNNLSGIQDKQVIYSDNIILKDPTLDAPILVDQTFSSDDVQQQNQKENEQETETEKQNQIDKKEKEQVKEVVHRYKSSLAEEIIHWTQWFKEFQFYRYGLAYTGVRLYCNVSSTMLTFYLIHTLKFQGENDIQTPIQIALIPLSLYLMSALTSPLLNKAYKMIGKKWTLTIGAMLCIGTSVCFIFLTPETKNLMYALAPIIGIAQAITLNTGITLISDVIGLRGASGAFVFGFYSFMDKISTGVGLFLCTNASNFEGSEYTRWVIVLVPSISCIFAWLLVVLPLSDDHEEDYSILDNIYDSQKGNKQLNLLQDELVT